VWDRRHAVGSAVSVGNFVWDGDRATQRPLHASFRGAYLFAGMTRRFALTASHLHWLSSYVVPGQLTAAGVTVPAVRAYPVSQQCTKKIAVHMHVPHALNV
jgi:hypothetical protein